MVRNYKVVVKRNDLTAILVNPKGYSPRVMRKERPLSTSVLAFSANYNWLNVPIGILRDHDNIKSISKYDHLRPVFMRRGDGTYAIVDKEVYEKETQRGHSFFLVACQAGPTIIRSGQYVDTIKDEKFRDDAVRPTDQICIGVTRSNKLLVVYSRNWTLKSVAQWMLQQDVVGAMKMDGGHAAFLCFRPDADDTLNKPITMGNPGLIPVGFELCRSK